ncbi:hypothetical protein ABZX93_35545 [Streptomyces sp. NPDC006632]|uniref:hypothetical protein n=1 Tax=Streptomyces sp. NPDC006632 TaxID=3157182 RepID=UPI0033BE0F86
MSGVPETVADQAKDRLEKVQKLVAFGLLADEANRHDQREWYRTLLRTAADAREQLRFLERELSDRADTEKILTPSEIAEAGKITRAALYKRREKS